MIDLRDKLYVTIVSWENGNHAVGEFGSYDAALAFQVRMETVDAIRTSSEITIEEKASLK